MSPIYPFCARDIPKSPKKQAGCCNDNKELRQVTENKNSFEV